MKFRYLLYALIFSCLIVCSNRIMASDVHPKDSNFVPKQNKVTSFFFKDTADYAKLSTINDLMAISQENKWGIRVGGYICTDLFWDTRQMVESRDGLLLLYPADVHPDINGVDINARPSFNFLALNTRVTLRIQASDALGAKISGMIEGWFAGMSNTDMNGFAMRHAFIKLDWKTTSLLTGQTWHPLFTESCFANTVAGSAGAPFQPFSRAPQIRVTQKLSKLSSLMIYINSQRDFLSFGTAGSSSSYLRSSAVPEVGLQYIFDLNKQNENNIVKHKLLFGVGGDYKYLIPRVVTDSNVYTRNGVHALAAIAFVNYQHTKDNDLRWGLKAKAMYGQACNEFLMLGGYAYRYYDNQPLDTRVDYEYTTINTIASWIDVYVKIKQWEAGVFGGYTQNLGSNKNIQDWNNEDSYFSRGHNIAYMYRISARAIYQAGKLQIGFEPEYTVACYGNTLNSLGEVQKSSDTYPNASRNVVSNLRILLSTTLFF